MTFFTELEKKFHNFIGKHKTPQITEAIFSKESNAGNQ
jgi:hypothetical protein